jgi:hypothetical protein
MAIKKMNKRERQRRIRELAFTFPVLKKLFEGVAASVTEEKLDDIGKWSTVIPARYAARFVLAVADSEITYEWTGLNIVAAMVSWDEAHRAAFLKWASEPWRL